MPKKVLELKGNIEMTPTDLEKLKAELNERLSKLIPNSYSDNTMLNVVDYLATTHRLIDLEKVEALRKTKTPYLQDHGYNAALAAVIALVKGEK